VFALLSVSCYNDKKNTKILKLISNPHSVIVLRRNTSVAAKLWRGRSSRRIVEVPGLIRTTDHPWARPRLLCPSSPIRSTMLSGGRAGERIRLAVARLSAKSMSALWRIAHSISNCFLDSSVSCFGLSRCVGAMRDRWGKRDCTGQRSKSKVWSLPLLQRQYRISEMT